MTADHASGAPRAGVDRRALLRLAGCAATAAMTAVVVPGLAEAGVLAGTRVLTLHNLNTGEHLTAEYFQNGRYQLDALQAIDWIMRDHRNDQVHHIDRELLDLGFRLHRLTGARRPFELICGYRSPATNAAMIRAGRSGVARRSYHLFGQAIDLRLPGESLRTLCRTARAMRAGGVGYYPRSNFIHVDVGPVRTW